MLEATAGTFVKGDTGSLQASPAQLSWWPWPHNTGPQFPFHLSHPPLGEPIPNGMIAVEMCLSMTLGQPFTLVGQHR